MKTIAKYLTPYAGLSLICFALSQNIMAEEISPLSPKFILQPDQILSNTNIAHQTIDFEAIRVIAGLGAFKSGSEISGDLIAQSFRLGLPDNYEIGIGETYSRGKSDDPKIVRVVDGFSSPTLFAKKTWVHDPSVQFSANLSATPKTGDHALRAAPTMYNIGFATTLTTPNGLVTTLGLSRSLVNGSAPDSTTFQIGAYKEIALYSFSFETSLNVSDKDNISASVLTVSTGLGRQIATNTWLQLFYRYADLSSKISDSIGTTDTTSSLNELGLSLKVLF